jgi:hypothetical protein
LGKKRHESGASTYPANQTGGAAVMCGRFCKS